MTVFELWCHAVGRMADVSPKSRLVQPPEIGHGIAIAQVGGLHHRYERRAA
jgi:hypothetical protein